MFALAAPKVLIPNFKLEQAHAAGSSQCRQGSGSSRDADAEDNLPYRILFHSDLDFLLILVLIFEEGGRSNECLRFIKMKTVPDQGSS